MLALKDRDGLAWSFEHSKTKSYLFKRRLGCMSYLTEPQCDAEHFRKTGGSPLVVIGRIALSPYQHMTCVLGYVCVDTNLRQHTRMR